MTEMHKASFSREVAFKRWCDHCNHTYEYKRIFEGQGESPLKGRADGIARSKVEAEIEKVMGDPMFQYRYGVLCPQCGRLASAAIEKNLGKNPAVKLLDFYANVGRIIVIAGLALFVLALTFGAATYVAFVTGYHGQPWLPYVMLVVALLFGFVSVVVAINEFPAWQRRKVMLPAVRILLKDMSKDDFGGLLLAMYKANEDSMVAAEMRYTIPIVNTLDRLIKIQADSVKAVEKASSSE